MDTTVDILKWVLLILLAGFIGQFGKSLSLRIIHYFQNKRNKGDSNQSVSAQEGKGSDRIVATDTQHKAAKKMLKGQIKLDKKRSKLKNK